MFSIKTATIADRFTIRELALKIWPATYGHILSPEQFDYMIDMMYHPDSILRQMTEEKQQFFIVYADDLPAGYLAIETIAPDRFIFQKIYILPECQGTGLGRYVVEQGVEWLKSNHPTPFTVMLYVNRGNPSAGFYTHIGFKETGIRDHHIGNGYYMNDYIMEMAVG